MAVSEKGSPSTAGEIGGGLNHVGQLLLNNMSISGTQSDRDRFLELVTQNPVNETILQRLPDLGFADCHLVAGCLFQTVWNCLAGKPPCEHILDYDVFYQEPSDLSWEAEDSVIQRSAEVFSDLGVDVQVRNQARVHLWYEARFGIECLPLRSTRDGIDHFLNTSSCFGILRSGRSTEIYAPFGFGDLFSRIVRPNPRRWLPDIYYQKAGRWLQKWPDLTVIPWPPSQALLGPHAKLIPSR